MTTVGRPMVAGFWADANLIRNLKGNKIDYDESFSPTLLEDVQRIVLLEIGDTSFNPVAALVVSYRGVQSYGCLNHSSCAVSAKKIFMKLAIIIII